MTQTPDEIRQRIASLSPWFYDFDLGPYGRTPTAIPPEVVPIFRTRLEMVNRAVDAHFGARLPEIRCIDVGCHEGFYSVAMAQKGLREVHGIDVRGASLEKARFVSDVLGLANVRYTERNCEDLKASEVGQYELTLCLGLLYHLENPVLCLRNIAALTKELCVIETQVIDEVEGTTEWGAQAWTRAYNGVLAFIDETPEFNANNAETGASPIVTCPSPKALRLMLKVAGFRRVEFIDPPPGAYEQLARRKRVVCAAWK